MKKEFSKKWKASRQPRKQRKYMINAPYHIKKRFLSANLSKELRKKHGMRNIEVRKGDKVKIMAGKFKRKEGKVNIVNIKRTKVSIEGIQRQKKDGTKINVYFHPSKLQIQELMLDDEKRLKSKKTGEKKLKEEKKQIETKTTEKREVKEQDNKKSQEGKNAH